MPTKAADGADETPRPRARGGGGRDGVRGHPRSRGTRPHPGAAATAAAPRRALARGGCPLRRTARQPRRPLLQRRRHRQPHGRRRRHRGALRRRRQRHPGPHRHVLRARLPRPHRALRRVDGDRGRGRRGVARPRRPRPRRRLPHRAERGRRGRAAGRRGLPPRAGPRVHHRGQRHRVPGLRRRAHRALRGHHPLLPHPARARRPRPLRRHERRPLAADPARHDGRRRRHRGDRGPRPGRPGPGRLLRHLPRPRGGRPVPAGGWAVTARREHVAALRRAQEELTRVAAALEEGGEVARREVDHARGGLDATAAKVAKTADEHRPAWLRPTTGENRWPVAGVILLSILLQLALPDRLTLLASWVLPALELALLIALVIAVPRRYHRRSRPLRAASLTLTALISLANGWSAAVLVTGLVNGTEGDQGAPLLTTGSAIGVTNVIAFALWSGHVARAGPPAGP